MNHASSTPPLTTRSIRIVAVVGFLLLGAGVVRAQTTTTIDRAATVDQVAIRVPLPDQGLLFPIASTPVCEVFNNFGGYSKTFGSGGHEGVDIGAALGQKVYAVEDGVLYREFSGSTTGIGWGLWSDTDTKYRYYHLDSTADGLTVGDRVVRGQVIGYVGSTANANPTGWHLHFEVRPGPDPWATPVDPVPLLTIPAGCNVY